ncbi:hypothetical protein ACVIU7_001534 [Bradyrhizobium liaoningense]
MVSRAHDDRPHFQHPQFLHRRPYRPWQIDAGRPSDPDDGRPLRPRDGGQGAGARFHGHRARARHHHQGADGAPPVPRQGRQGLHLQPDGHARPCRLRLRSLAVAGGVRRFPPGGRRQPGRRGADARQRLPGARQQSRDRPGPKQGRPARRRAREGQAADRGRHRHRRFGCGDDLGQDRPRRPRRAGSDRHPPATAEGRPRRDTQGAAGRQLVRRLSRRRRAGAHRRRHDEEGPARAHDGHWRGLRRRARRLLHAEDDAGRRARPRRDRLHHRRD